MPSEASTSGSKSNENLAPNRSERLSRSPHPYLRRHDNIKQDAPALAEGSPAEDAYESSTTSLQPKEPDSPTTYFDADHRKRRKLSSSPSDSGTEADDERGAFLTGLPAPPLRPRKGLKDGYGTSSPLLTPSYLDDATRKAISGDDWRLQASVQSQVSTGDEGTKLREKYKKKRRAELARRITETLLLGVVVYISTGKAFRLVAFPRPGDPVYAIASEAGHPLPLSLLVYCITLPSLYGLYPIRIIFKNHSRSLLRNKAWYYIHIPAAFDPAVLLYPPIIPPMVALSLLRGSPKAVLLNLCLGIASVPSKVIPLNDNVPWYSSVQWLLSAAPVLIAEGGLSFSMEHDQLSKPSVFQENDVVACSYLLHQALMPVLGYLTTTSLLPAELQLLSISLINLLFLAASPQAVILQALLWIGGLSLFVLCGKILNWEVALARVPTWRFRKSQEHSRPRRKPRLSRVLDETLSGRLSSWGLIPSNPEDSDSDAPPVQPNATPRKSRAHLTKINTSGLGGANGSLKVKQITPLSAAGDGTFSMLPSVNSTIDIPPALRTHQRRFTMPSYSGSPSEMITHDGLQHTRSGRPKDLQAWSFRSLTTAQATVLSWVFAFYVYIIVILLIVFPIRQYIGSFALDKHEPVGWALGYMFGGIPWFQSLVKDLALDRWVVLSLPAKPSVPLGSSRQAVLLGQAIKTSNVRLLICFYCLGIIGAGLAIVFRLSAFVEVDTRRKVFHGMMVVMFLPTIFVDPPFIALALILILAIFLLLDLFRASQLPPLSKPLTYFLAPYVDGRDHRGPVIVSHIFLLIGCAVPLWLSLVATPRKEDSLWPGWTAEACNLSMAAGVVCVGMGDAAASLVGRRFGRRRWPWTGGKSLEGSLAFAIAAAVGLIFARAWLLCGGWTGDSGDAWSTTLCKAAIAGCGASLTEAVLTGGNDNVVVPVILWLLVRGLEM